MRDIHERAKDLREAYSRAGDSEHAKFHKAYHKSALSFHGLKTPAMRKLLNQHFPKRVTYVRDDLLQVSLNLWGYDSFEERFAAVELLRRVAPELRVGDLATVKRLTKEADGWAHLDMIGVYVLGTMALNHGERIYRKVFGWRKDSWMWTRRAAILIHVLPGRQNELADEYAWATFDDLLKEREFFIRKAIGWTLREIAKSQPKDVRQYVKDRSKLMAGLTRREAMKHIG